MKEHPYHGLDYQPKKFSCTTYLTLVYIIIIIIIIIIIVGKARNSN